tara:strand:+ start:12951 stop:13733 length:783 start_codon:yes stop_codon:yes gene_type:complete
MSDKMSDKVWVDNIYELLTLEFNPIGVSTNKQINILTKLSILVSVLISVIKQNFTTTKRTVLFIAIIMGFYIFFSGLCNGTQIKPPEQTKPPSTTEPFTEVNYNNPVGNPELSTARYSTGPTRTQIIEGPTSNARVLGTSINTDDWDSKEPTGNQYTSLAMDSLQLSPEIEAALTHKMPMDPSDEFYGANFSRQIYRIADDQGNFADSLYGQGPGQSCKQGSVFAHLGKPYSVYTTACSGNNNDGQKRRTGLFLPPSPIE